MKFRSFYWLIILSVLYKKLTHLVHKMNSTGRGSLIDTKHFYQILPILKGLFVPSDMICLKGILDEFSIGIITYPYCQNTHPVSPIPKKDGFY